MFQVSQYVRFCFLPYNFSALVANEGEGRVHWVGEQLGGEARCLTARDGGKVGITRGCFFEGEFEGKHFGAKRKTNLWLERVMGGDAHSVQGSRRFGGRGGRSCVGDAKEDAPAWGVDTRSRWVSWGTRMAWPVGPSEAGRQEGLVKRENDFQV